MAHDPDLDVSRPGFDPTFSCRWVGLGFLCCFSIREFGGDDSLDAFHNIVRAKILADAEEWPTDLTNVGLVPKLTKDLHGSPTHTKWV